MVNLEKRNLTIVVGLGKTGLSCLRYLTKCGRDIAVVDTRIHPPCFEEFKRDFAIETIPHFFGSLDAPFLNDACELVISPGVSLHEPLIAAQIAKGIAVVGDIELFVQEAQAPIIAITGSNGKSTVTSLVGEMAKAAGTNVKVGGNLGAPALDLLDDKVELYVLELSSFQLETTSSLAGHVATILNISEDHMDRYSDLAEYIAAKQRIYHKCRIAVMNRDDPLTYPKAHEGSSNSKRIISFGLETPKDNEFGVVGDHLVYGKQQLLAIDELQIKGKHQVANALAALTLGYAINLPLSAMCEVLRKFPGLPHRCQLVATLNGVAWYNDSKATNVGAAKAAIEGLGESISGKLVLIAGGIGKGADFSPLRSAVAKYVRALILIGRDAEKMAEALEHSCDICFANSMQQAVIFAKKLAHRDDAVLLAPACASFDMFDNFEHRGEVFIESL